MWGFLNVLEPYYKGGEYDFLLNSDKQLDLLNKRFIVFELDNIRDNKVLLPIVTIIIMETFYQQDAQVERYPENNSYRRVLEGIGIRQHE